MSMQTASSPRCARRGIRRLPINPVPPMISVVIWATPLGMSCGWMVDTRVAVARQGRNRVRTQWADLLGRLRDFADARRTATGGDTDYGQCRASFILDFPSFDGAAYLIAANVA